MNRLLDGLRRLTGARLDFPDGTRIEFAGPELIRCFEAGRTIEIEWHFGAHWLKSERVLPLDRITHWNAPSEEELTPAKKQEIVGKIQQYARKRGVKLDVIRSFNSAP